jgi:hypothetical protein
MGSSQLLSSDTVPLSQKSRIQKSKSLSFPMIGEKIYFQHKKNISMSAHCMGKPFSCICINIPLVLQYRGGINNEWKG